MSIELQENTSLCLPKPNYNYITTEEDARRAMNIIDKYPIIGVDTEATGLDPFDSKIVLVQIGLPNEAYVFDIRHDTEHSSLHLDVLKPILVGNNQLRLLQNATYDMKMIKAAYGFYVENIYCTMLTEQLLHLGLHSKASLDHLVNKYLGLTMTKQPRETFKDYYQKFKGYQLEYAASDAIVLHDIRNCQLPFIKKHGFEDVCRLEFEFTKPMCEMELSGIKLDVKKWRAIMGDTEKEMIEVEEVINNLLTPLEDQTTLFGVSLIDINSPLQLKKALNKLGLPLENTRNEELSKYKGVRVVDALLEYRKYAKLISTYAEPVIERIHSKTGRLYTSFKQMVSTGRMSSANPNLQNIPKKQMYRSCFIAEEGNVLITSDQASAELRILGNLSEDPSFIQCFKEGIDLHTKTASDVFGISMNKVTENQRDVAKTLNFGLCVSGDTKLITDVGIKKIKEIEVNEFVSHDVGAHKIIDKKFMGEKEVFELTTQYGYSMQLTNDHVIKVIDEYGNYIDKKLFDVNLDKDYACIKKGSNLFNDELYTFDEFSVEKRTNYKNFELPKYLDVYWASFLGLFVAEGALIKAKKHRASYACVSFGFSNKNKDFIDSIERLFYKLFNNRISRTEVKKNNTIRYSINSVLLSQWLFNLFDFTNFNKKSKYIHVPGCIKQSPKNVQALFLKMMFEGDGTIKKNNNSYTISYSSKSVNLISDIQLMLLNFGILSSINWEGRKKYPGEKYYYLNIISHNSKVVFMNEIGFVSECKTCRAIDTSKFRESVYFLTNQNTRLKEISKLLGPVKRIERFKYDMVYNCLNYTTGVGDVYLERLKDYDPFFKFIYDNGIVPLPIKSIKSVGIKGVYDISVEKRPYFLANGFIVHNCYGLSKFGLAQRLGISEKKAGKIIDTYFSKYQGVKKYLEGVAKEAVYKRYSMSVSGRKRFYRLPEYSDPSFNKVKRGVERKAKNMGIQASDADTIKQAMIYFVDRLKKSGYDARLVLTVHDEIVVETKKEQQYEVAKLVKQAVIDGFGHYFHLIPMETQALIGPCWLKNSCKSKDSNGKKCGGTEMVSVSTTDKYGSRIICKKCGGEI